MFLLLYRLFVNLTDESVECTEKSIRFTDLKKNYKFVNLTDFFVHSTDSSAEFTKNL